LDPIDPIVGLVDKTEELLGHSPHPAIVSVPIGAWTVSNICDGLALLTGNRRYDDAARLSMAVGLVGAAGAVVTGLRDYSYIPRERPSHEIATKHALGNAVVGTLFATSYILRVRDLNAGEPTRMLSRVLAIAGGSLSLYTAWLGGVLVEEHGEGVKPVMERTEDDRRDGESDDESRGRGRLAPEAPLGLQASP